MLAAMLFIESSIVSLKQLTSSQRARLPLFSIVGVAGW